MQPLAVELRILRTLLTPDVRIATGRAIMARVVSADGGGRGSLSIAGFVVEAELPKHVRAGEDLRLVVRDVSAERVLLSLSDPANPPGTPVPTMTGMPLAEPPAPPVALPGGGTVQVTERDHGSADGSSPDSHSLTLRYDAPALGAVDLRFELDPSSLRVTVAVRPGDPLTAAQSDAGRLRAALGDTVGRAISVNVSARREPLDVYA
jgi:hypothetical protein